MTSIALSLDELELNINEALDNNGILIYYHQLLNNMMYLIREDQEKYHQELKNLRRCLRDGRVNAVIAGDSITVRGRELHTMLVAITDTECGAYFLLHRTGLVDDMDYTPYFFTSETSRDNAIAYINRGM